MPPRPRGLRDDYRRDAHTLNGVSQSEVQVLLGIEPEKFVPILKEHIRRSYEHNLVNAKEWCLLPEIPSAREMLGETYDMDDSDDGDEEDERPFLESNLPYNIVDGPWPDKEAYVEAHYRLLREDVTAPLRNAIATFKADQGMLDDGDVAIYDHVHIVGYTFSNQGPAARIEFSYERAGKRIRWRQSKRLQQGTLVVLTPRGDNFKKVCKVAVVAARPLTGLEQNPPQVDLFWGDPREMEFDSTEAWTMIEARTGYFEANRHMLVAMQKLMTESFPMAKQLVDVERIVPPPKFVKEQPLMNLRSLPGTSEPEGLGGLSPEDTSARLENVDILSPWPEIEGCKLDTSQMEALRRILSKKVAIVQGPPGTGKTFVSISALRIMLDNWLPKDPPIIVAAQTNHALDQLLKLIAPIEPNFLRLGGRTEKENVQIKERTLYEVRTRAPNAAKAPYYNAKNAKRALDDHAAQLKADIVKAITQDSTEAELLRDLEIITKEQFESLSNDDWTCAHEPSLPPGLLAVWLGQTQLTTKVPCCPPINMGFDEEELDPDFEDLNEDELEVGKDDDDIDTLRGDFFSYRENWTGKSSMGWSPKRIKKLLSQTTDLWEIPDHLRGEFYRYFRRLLKKGMLDTFHAHCDEYMHSCQNIKLARWQSDATMVKRLGIKLIGCTTTGLSKYRGLLACLAPRTLLIEEAAETTEGTVLAAMFESIEQLILVGDHQQLQAHCNIQQLGAAPYNLAISMFERLVDNGVEFTMLNRQRRMIKEIRELLNPFYPELKDHPSVNDRLVNRLPVPGMGGRDSYFFHHQWPESRDETASRSNIDEAEMIAKFYSYLVLNGVDAAQITVLTFYNGQRKKLLAMLKAQPQLMGTRSFNVFTVDSYQGEENDIVLLSLVRSNESRSIGFLENKNRAVVSLSRARLGFYIFGNAKNLIAASDESYNPWGTVTDTFRRYERMDVHRGLPVVCENHGATTFITEPHEWDNINGGCEMQCGGILPCGHACPHKCHPCPHESIACKSPCEEVLLCGHGCSELCGDPCACSCNHHVRRAPPNTQIYEPSLDDVLNDQLTMGANNPTPSAKGGCLSNDTTALDLKAVESWRAWDASQADRELSTRRSEQSAHSSPQKVTIEETHRAAVYDVEAGHHLKGIKIRSVHRWKSTVPKDNLSVHSTSSYTQPHLDESLSCSASSNISREMEELLDIGELTEQGKNSLFDPIIAVQMHATAALGAAKIDEDDLLSSVVFEPYDVTDVTKENLSLHSSDNMEETNLLHPLQRHVDPEEDLIIFD